MLIHLGLLLACFLWAISFIASKVALESAPPLTVVALRLILSALCFVVWFIIRGWPKIEWTFARIRQLVLLSLIGTTFHYGIQTVGLQYTAASNASLYAATCPISIAVIAAIFLRERLTWCGAVGIFLALSGALLAIGFSTLLSLEFRGRLFGDVLVFTSIFLWAIFTVYSKKITEELGAMELLGIVTIVGAITTIPVGGVEMWRHGAHLSSVTLKSWVAIGFLGLTCSFLATLLYFLALEKLESQRVGVYLYTIPLMTYVVAWLYLGEHVGWNLAGGSALVLAGVYLTERGAEPC
ncbi:MAG: DMT family transporter [Deltaproteobacteria bacterium]|nr:DMT family transporter [Deltaproteobacteria bacterium]